MEKELQRDSGEAQSCAGIWHVFGTGPGKTIKDQAKCGLNLKRKKKKTKRPSPKSRIDGMMALCRYCQSYFTYLDLTNECCLCCFQPKIPIL